MRTIPRRLSRDRPRGDYRAMCDYCGCTWHRSDLMRDASGLLRCPDETGRDAVTLDRLNARHSMQRRPVYRKDGGSTDPTSGGDGTLPDTSLVTLLPGGVRVIGAGY